MCCAAYSKTFAFTLASIAKKIISHNVYNNVAKFSFGSF